MGSSTKIVPTTSTSSGQTNLPAWADQAGQKAVSIASGIADKPYQPYTGQLVSDLSPNTSKAITYASQNTGAGTNAINLGLDQTKAAADYGNASVGTGQGALGNAADAYGNASTKAAGSNDAGSEYLDSIRALTQGAGAVSAGSINAGQDATTAAGNGYLAAQDLGNQSVNAGQDAVASAGTNANQASDLASNSQNAGQMDAALSSAIARLSGGQALGSTNAGAADLDAARGYTADSASAVTGGDLASYMNPYASLALDPAAQKIQRQAAQDNAAIQSKAAMANSFGGSRQGILEGMNERSLQENIGNLYQTGLSDAYDKAMTAAENQKTRSASAAGLATGVGNQANIDANDAISRLTNSAGAIGESGTRQSDLANSALGRLTQASGTQNDVAKTQSGLATDAQGRLMAASPGLLQTGAQQSQLSTDAVTRLLQSSNAGQSAAANESDLATGAVNRDVAAGNAQTSLAGAQEQAANSDEDRLLASVNPAYAGAQSQLSQVQSDINNLLQTGAIDQTEAQNKLDVAYQQFTDQRDWATNQLNALLSTLSGVPYSTSTNVKSTGESVVQQPSALGQIAGLGLSAASLIPSDETKKEDIADIDDEDVLRKVARLSVKTWRYKPEFRDAIGDDGRTRIGPMAQNWGKEFANDPTRKVIPMPEINGAMIAAIKALEKRTRKLAA